MGLWGREWLYALERKIHTCKTRAAPHNGARRFGQCFDTSESMENAEILDVFPIFHTARLGQKIRRSPLSPPSGVALEKRHIGIGRYDKCIVRTCHSEPVRTLVWESPSISGQSIVIQFVFSYGPPESTCVLSKNGFSIIKFKSWQFFIIHQQRDFIIHYSFRKSCH